MRANFGDDEDLAEILSQLLNCIRIVELECIHALK